MRGAPRSAHDMVLSLAGAHRGPESQADVEELECWVLRDRLFEAGPSPAIGPELPGD